MFCQHLNERFASSNPELALNPLQLFSSLDDYDIYAGDGHYRAASTHEPKKDNKKYAIGHFYTLNLRTHMLTHLDGMLDEPGRKKEHDIHLLKRSSVKQLRQGAAKGRKVIYVWGSARIDCFQWYKWKQSSGIYFISVEKGNMKAHVQGQLSWDRENCINVGVIADELVGIAGVSVRRVKYQCPSSGKHFNFLTTLTAIEPGLIAHLYKLRWSIEKVFDELKTKLNQNKAWGKSPTCKNMQAQLTCLLHNLMVNFENVIAEQEQLADMPEEYR